MNSKRLVVLLLAAAAAGVVALMVRNVLGGGAKSSGDNLASAPVEISEVLVASQRIDAGTSIHAGQVRWQAWPAKIVDASFVRKSSGLTPASIVEGTVARAPMVEGEPITYTKIVKSEGAGFMAATLAPGMRAISISVSVVSIAGGFVLPNNRVDVLLTSATDDSKRGASKIILSNVRVLAIDQSSDDKNQKAVSEVKTVTLELTPGQARTVAMAQATGTLSLALRSLGDDNAARKNSNDNKVSAAGSVDEDDAQSGMVTVLRYGRVRKTAGGGAQ